jgi:predicted MPP superfamily phosphohydrolase
MSLLFFTAFTLYGISHLYLFMKLQSSLQMSTGIMFIPILFLSYMTLSPLIIHLYSRRGSLAISRFLAFPSYLWIALVFFFLITSFPIELYNFSVKFIASLLHKDFSSMLFTPFFSFFIPFSLSAVLTTYGYFEAKDLRTERITIASQKLPETVRKLTIAQITDFHLGIVVRENMLEKVIKAIEHINPDIIVSTGDLLDGEINHVDELAERLKKLRARLGKYAITGNHEFFAGIEYSLKFIENADFTILRNRGLNLDKLINIAGIDDPFVENKHFGDASTGESERNILSNLPRENFTLLLKHRPEIDIETLGLYDLQLSGHTHKGQMFPAGLIIKLFFYPHYTGFTELFKGSALYVSRGTGTTLCPVRFLAPPEITVIDIVNARKEKKES